MSDLRSELYQLIVSVVVKRRITWPEAVDLVKTEIDEIDAIHNLGRPLTEREAARADAVAEGNPEGFSAEPDPLPDAFLEDAENR